MKKIIIPFMIIGLLLVTQATAWSAPKAVPVDSVYNFEPVPEGTTLSHDFIVKNEGDTVLNITGVIPP